MKFIHTYGAEIEKPVAMSTGQTHAVGKKFFDRLALLARERQAFDHLHMSDIQDNVALGVVSRDIGEQGVDNGFNLLETAVSYASSLSELEKKLSLDLASVMQALEEEQAVVVNMSIHPRGRRDLEFYRSHVAPKGVYPYIWFRGWDHTAGIDGRAQNSPSTGIPASQAADAVSVIIGAGAAFIGLFGNGPYEEGNRSVYKEARCTMWGRMMGQSKVHGDRDTAQFPPQRFRTMAQYFQWMFGGATGIHFVLADKKDGTNDYKGIGDRLLLIPGNPSVLTYLSQPEWDAIYLKDLQSQFPPQRIEKVKPRIAHMETMQFAQFAGARIRYGLKSEGFPLADFVHACNRPGKFQVEEIFEKHASFVYIEGRDAGANFPDAEIRGSGSDVADSVVISPSALQAGLIGNVSEVAKYIDSFSWRYLGILRDAAIRDGLDGRADGISVYDFTQKIVELAIQGLHVSERKFLRYPEWVLQERKNGADRAIAYVESLSGNLPTRLDNLVQSRKVML